MPILKSKPEMKSVSHKINISEQLFREIKSYCNWSGMRDENEFFIEAAEYILAKDSDWKKHKKLAAKQQKEEMKS